VISQIRSLLRIGQDPKPSGTKVVCWGCALQFPAEVIDWRSGPHPLCPCCRKDLVASQEARIRKGLAR
jgi:hypothetical protein